MGKSQDLIDRASIADKICRDPSRKKLIMAGPGTGKTHLFRALIAEENKSLGSKAPGSFLVLTFINALVEDLSKDLEGQAAVKSLHAYCRDLLGLQLVKKGAASGRQYYDKLVGLIKEDWEWIKKTRAPEFAKQMRNLSLRAKEAVQERDFYLARTDYYNAFADDDTVFRALLELKANPSKVPKHTMVLVDEFQDFNAMEASFIDLLAEGGSRMVIAGDDDQALYSALREATWNHIRAKRDDG